MYLHNQWISHNRSIHVEYFQRNYGMINVIWNETDIMSSKVQLHIYGNRTIDVPVLA